MKIITLNAWGGRLYNELSLFIKNNQDVDVFCFQEFLKEGQGRTNRGEMKNLYEKIGKALTNHNRYFYEYGDGGYYGKEAKNLDFKYGIACFIKKECTQSFIDGISLFEYAKKWNDYEGHLAAGAALCLTVSDYLIINVHGLWQKNAKKDTEARIEQSKKIIKLSNTIKGNKIICGDFNLEPSTESIKMIEDLPMTNLIKENKVTSTRTALYDKDTKFADYLFVDTKVNVLNFRILPDEVSDHSPIYVEVN